MAFLKRLWTLPIDIFNKSLFVRYVFSGGSAAAIDVLILYILTTYLNIYYLAAATFALTVSFLVRFILQKFLTFQNEDTGEAKQQFLYYSILYACSLVMTNALLYLFFEKMHMWIVTAQILSIGIMACGSFLVYRYIIFPEKKK